MATQAYMDRVDLSAHGFYATPEVTGEAWGAGLLLCAKLKGAQSQPRHLSCTRLLQALVAPGLSPTL
jgi:hypothetical protein